MRFNGIFKDNSKINLAPIVLFVYNRLDHTKKTIKALKKNKLSKDSELIIYSDGPKNKVDDLQVQAVRKFINNISGFKKIKIIKKKSNQGLSKSIINGVTEIINIYKKIIVLEDDLVTSPYFLVYMNNALNLYKNDPKVASIHGYIYPIKNLPETFFIKGADCWGWGTWDNRWSLFQEDGSILLNELKRKNLLKEFCFNDTYNYKQMLIDQINGMNDSWAIRWYASSFLKNKLTLYPGKSYIQNIGFDYKGTNTKQKTSLFKISLNNHFSLDKIKIEESKFCRKKIEKFHKSLKQNIFKKLISKLFSISK